MKFNKFLLPLLLCVALFATVGCARDKILAKPQDTSLEFWVTEKVTSEDFEDHYRVYDVFGAQKYYGKDYQPSETTEENSDIQPKHCVTYTVTAYPDYSSNNGKIDTVTRIEITDPQVNVYGIACNSALEDFDEAFENLGCTVQEKGLIHIATYGKVKIALASYDENQTLTVWVEVTNKQGIVF